MALKLSATEAAKVAIQSIGRGYDITLDHRLKYVKGDSVNPACLIEINEDQVAEIVLPGGIVVPNVSKLIKCDVGDRTRFRSDVLTFRQMSDQFNQEMSLTGKIPSGLFNAMFEFSGSWQNDADKTKTLAFDGIFVTLYTVALEMFEMVLCDHVKNAVPLSWEPPALARFIENFGTHIIVGVKMGGKDVIYVKQQHLSALHPADVKKKLKAMGDKRFLDSDGQNGADSKQIYQNDKGIVSICKRRGGKDLKSLTHNEWLHTVELEPDVTTMSFIPITSLLGGVRGSGFLSHAINLYMRYKPPIEELNQFLEFQLPRKWAPVFSELPQRRQQSTPSLQFSFMGPKLYVNTNAVDVAKRPVTGLRLSLEGRRGDCLAIHMQHLVSLPKPFQLQDAPNGNFCQMPYDRRYYKKVKWRNFSHVCTAPVESHEDLSIVTGAQLQVGDYGFKRILFLRLCFSTVVGAAAVRHPEWDDSLACKSGIVSTFLSFSTAEAQKPPPTRAEININSAVCPGGPPAQEQGPKLLEFVDTTELTRGPQDSPGYWVVSGARLLVEKGRIWLQVKYSLLNVILPDKEAEEVPEEQ